MAALIGISISALFSAHAINTFSHSAKQIYNVINNISLYNQSSDILIFIKNLDIEKTISLIEILIKEINIPNMSQTLKLCISNITEVVLTIEKELIEIYDKIHYNNNIWLLKKWRKWSFTSKCNTLSLYNNVLTTRYKILAPLRILPVFARTVHSNCSTHR